MEGKKFEVGIYKYTSREIQTVDELRLKDGDTIACFYPLVHSICFGVHQESGTTHIISRKNLTLMNVITLFYEQDFMLNPKMQDISDTWAKLNAICVELKRSVDQAKPLHERKNLHETPGNPPL